MTKNVYRKLRSCLGYLPATCRTKQLASWRWRSEMREITMENTLESAPNTPLYACGHAWPVAACNGTFFAQPESS